jgi:hypothetical protein
MRTSVGLMLVLLVGCGREIVDEKIVMPTEPVETGGGAAGGSVEAKPPSPGWYDVPANPVEYVGTLVVQPTDGRTLRATVMLSSTAPAGDYTVAVAWRGATQLQSLGVVRKDQPDLLARLAPPAQLLTQSRCGSSASGVLFVLSGGLSDGVIVGASAGGWVGDFALDFSECGASTRGNYFVLQRDARYEHARCLALSGQCVDTSPVRVTRGALRIDDSGISLESNLGFTDANNAVSLEVNGVVVPDRRTSAVPRELFKDGKNRITVRMGQHTPWEANVVLPTGALSPSVPTALSMGKPFSVVFAAVPWATDYRVDLYPVDAPWTRAVYPSFSSPTSPIEGTFDGFPSGTGGRVTGTRASVRLTATRTDGEFTLIQETSLEAPISP